MMVGCRKRENQTSRVPNLKGRLDIGLVSTVL